MNWFEKVYREFDRYNIFSILKKINQKLDLLTQKSEENSEEIININNKILDVNNKLEKINDSGDYCPLSFHFVDEWKDYYLKNKEQIPHKLQVLKENMPEESQNTVDLVFERFIFLAPYEKYKDAYLYRKNSVFTQDEFQQIAGIINNSSEFNKKIKENHKLPLDSYADSVFLNDNGLEFLPEYVKKYISGKNYIDGGAWIGDTALVFRKYNPEKVFAFEPQKDNFDHLLETIKINNEENRIIPVNYGLGNQKEEISLYGDSANSSFKKRDINEDKAEIIKITTIDDFVNENNLSNVGLIKLDIEGYELEAIQGAMETIKNNKPVLLISIYHLPKDFFEIKPLIEKEVPGYKFMVRKLVPYSPTSEVMLIGYPEMQ